MNITNFETTVYNPILKTETKGFVNKSLLETYMTNKTKKKIPVGLEYRPDLIAREYLGDESLGWVITYINNFKNGIKDYTQNRSIYIPNI